MLWRAWVGVLFLSTSAGCTAIRPLDVTDAGAERDAHGSTGDSALDAASLVDTGGVLSDTGVPAEDAGSDAGIDGASTVDAGHDAAMAIDANCGVEVCGGGDEDCDGTVDEADAVGAMTYYVDADRDNYGAATGTMMACHAPATGGPWLTRGGDCDDTDRLINPSRSENCNGKDDDCNGAIDDGPISCSPTCSLETYMGHAYQFCTDTRTQVDALGRCTAMGYHLVNIGDMGENDFVQMRAMAHAVGGGGMGNFVWIGLMQVGSTTSYAWTDGTTATYLHWDAGALEPNGTGPCVRMRPLTGLWADTLCAVATYGYVCEAP